MYRYKGKIRIGGSMLNEVSKINMSAAEVIVLRKLHGSDAVIDLVELKNDKSSHEEERRRLKTIYGVNRQTENRTRLNFLQMFGPDHIDLPARLPEFEPRAEAEEQPAPKNARLKNKTDVSRDEVELAAIAG